MKFRIEVSGRGGEIVIGRVSQDAYAYFEEHEIDVDEYATSWDNDYEVPEELQPFVPGEWHDCDDIAHEFGSDVDDTFITVTDADDNVLLDNVDYSNLIKIGVNVECEDDIDPDDILEAGAVCFIGQSHDKGLFYSFEVETDAFDVSRLTLYTVEVDGWGLVTNIQYNGEDLEDLGEMSTVGKGYDFSMRVIGEG